MKKTSFVWTTVFVLAYCNVILLGHINGNQEKVLRFAELESKYSVCSENLLCLNTQRKGIVENKELTVNSIRVEENHKLADDIGIVMTERDVSVLERIVEAEAGGEDQDGKLLVANVVLNRVRDEDFPDTIEEVVFQKSNGVTQFSPVANGRYEKVTISEDTVEAVKRALDGEDISQGALYFAARKIADKTAMKWFDEQLTYLFVHGGHEFFR